MLENGPVLWGRFSLSSKTYPKVVIKQQKNLNKEVRLRHDPPVDSLWW